MFKPGIVASSIVLATNNLHRYWRFYITALNNGSGVASMAEFQMRATAGGADQLNPAWSYSGAQLSSTYAASKAADNDTATRWQTPSGTALPLTWSVDTGAGNEIAVAQYTMYHNLTTTNTPRNWQLQWSDNNVDWTTIHTASNTSFTGGVTYTYTI